MIEDPHILKSLEGGMMIPEWRKAIETELEEFRLHNCLILIIFYEHSPNEVDNLN